MKQEPLFWHFIRTTLSSVSLVGICLFLLTLGVQADDHLTDPRVGAVSQSLQRPAARVPAATGAEEPTAVLLSEGFEAEAFPPVGWQITSSVDTCTWSRSTQGYNPPQQPYAGSGQALFNAYNCDDGAHTVLTLPPVDLSGNGNYVLAFWMYHDPENYPDARDQISVTVAALSLTTAQPLTVTADVILRTDRRTLDPAATEGWGFHTIPLALPTDTDLVNATVQLQGVANYGNNIFLDDLRIELYSGEQPPTCATKPFPVDGSTTPSGATELRWTPGQGATPTGFRVALGRDNPPTTIFASRTISYVVGAPPVIPVDLPAQSQLYYWQVIPFNHYGTAPDCPIWRFVTPSPYLPTAAIEPFDQPLFPPLGWLAPPDTCHWSLAGSGTDGSAQFDAASCAVNSQARLIAAPFDLRLPGVRHLLRFRVYHDTSLPDYSDYLQVEVSTNSNGPFTPLGDPILRTGGVTGWKNYIFDLSDDPALREQPAVYISFVGVSQNGADLRIDDVAQAYHMNACVWTAAGGTNDFAAADNWECGESPSRRYWQIIPDLALAPVATTAVDVGGLLLRPHAQLTVTGAADVVVGALSLFTDADSTLLMGRGAVTSTAMAEVGGRLDLRQSRSVHLHDVKVNAGGELLAPSRLQITGDLTNTGHLPADTVVLAGHGHQRIAGTLTVTNLLISEGVTLTVAGSLTVTGQLTNHGWILEARTFSAGQPIHQEFAWSNLTLDVTAGHGLTGVTVRQHAEVPPQREGAQLIAAARYWTIHPTGTAYHATLTLPHALPMSAYCLQFPRDIIAGTPLCSKPQICHLRDLDAPGWQCAATTYNVTSVTLTGITDLTGYWAIGAMTVPILPTVPTLPTLTATPSPTVPSTPTPTVTASPTVPSTPTPTATATVTPVPTLPPLPTVTPLPSATGTNTPAPPATATATSAPSATATPSPTATKTNPPPATGTATTTPNITPSPVVAAPVVISIVPDHGPATEVVTVTIRGINFAAAPTLFLDEATVLTPSNRVSGAEIVAHVPAGMAPGRYALRVCNPPTGGGLANQCGLLFAAYTVTGSDPLVHTVVPSWGYNDAPNDLLLTGFNFQRGLAVAIGGQLLTETVRSNSTRIRTVAPAGLPPGDQAVTVHNPGGAPVTWEGLYTVLPADSDDFAASTEDLWTEPPTVRQGDIVKLGLNLYRRGGIAPRAVTVAFYRQLPDGALQLIGRQTSAPLAGGPLMMTPLFVEWPTTGLPSAVQLVAVIDPDNTLPEYTKSNNTIRRYLTLLPAATDTTPPLITQLLVNNGVPQSAQAAVTITLAANDAPNGEVVNMYLIEREFNATARQWVAIHASGWRPYQPTLPWTLFNRGGVRTFQAWVSDAAGNISATTAQAQLTYFPPSDMVGAGQVRLYRYPVTVGQAVAITLTSQSGDADLYVWSPDGLRRYGSNLEGSATETIHFQADQSGMYQIEVYGYTAATYHVTVTTSADQGALAVAPLAALSAAKTPRHEPIIAPTSQPADAVAVVAAPLGPAISTNVDEEPEPRLDHVLYLPLLLR